MQTTYLLTYRQTDRLKDASTIKPVEKEGRRGKLLRAPRRLEAPKSPKNIKYTRMRNFKKKN